jgi:CRISPR-associated protein (Cas_Cas02710)
MLTFPHKSISWFKNIVSPSSSKEFVGFIVLAVFTNLLSGGNPIGLFGVASIGLLWWWKEQDLRKRFSIALKSKEAPRGARGMILLLSPYSPFSPALKDKKLIQPLIDKILDTPVENLAITDFEAIGLFNSNLVPQIKAVEYHFQESRLNDIWLISTKSDDIKNGSKTSAKILEKFLNFQYKQIFKVHIKGLCVEDWNYAQLRSVSEKIFQDSEYKDNSIVADITGGTKVMSMALAMTCAQPGRRMQYMDSQRDWQGNPLKNGEIQAVGIDVTLL